jgi:xylulokinase
MTAPNLARAAVEGLLCGIAEGLDALAAQMAAVGTPLRRVILTGKGARLDAVRLIAPAIFGVPVAVAVSGSFEDGPGGGLTSTGVFAALDATGVPRPGSGRPTGAVMLGGSEIMAIGAARQAAWVLAASTAPGGEAPKEPPAWN